MEQLIKKKVLVVDDDPDTLRAMARLLGRKFEVTTAEGPSRVYLLLHAARADLLRQLGILADAAASYARALALVSNNSERRFLERRLREMQALDA